MVRLDRERSSHVPIEMARNQLREGDLEGSGTPGEVRDDERYPARTSLLDRRRERRPSGAARQSRRVSIHQRCSADHVPRAVLDHAPVRWVRHGRGVEPPLPVPAPVWPDGPLGRLRSRHADGRDSDHPLARGEVGKVGVAIDSIRDMATLLDGLPLREVSTSMTINSTAAILLAMYQAIGERQGRGSGRSAGDHPERHPEGVRSARHVHLPASTFAAHHHRHLRLHGQGDAAMEPDLHKVATTYARRARRRSRRWPSRSRMGSPTWRRR